MSNSDDEYTINGVGFSKRERRLINNCIGYCGDDPAGLPGHNLMIIIAKLAKAYSITSDLEYSEWRS